MTSIFDYEKAHIYLRDYIHSLPKKGWGVGSKLARALQVNTSHVSLILSGDHQFSMEQAHGVTEFFGWAKLETQYFVLLVSRDRAGTPTLRKFYTTQIEVVKKEALNIRSRVSDFKGLSEEHRARFYSSWIYSAIRLFCSTNEESGKSIEEIEKAFNFPRAELAEMANFLVEAGLLKMNDDRYLMGEQRTYLDRGSLHLLKHYSNWRLKALQRAEHLSEEELMFSAVHSMSQADFLKVREDIMQVIKSSLETVKASPPEIVVAMNIDWFRVLG